MRKPLTIVEHVPVPISEEQFLNLIVDTAYTCGWLVHHGRTAWTSKGYRTPIQGDAGFPDLFLARPPRVLVVELKSEKGKLSAEQKAWGEILKQCPGIKYYQWRPSQFDDEIVSILR